MFALNVTPAQEKEIVFAISPMASPVSTLSSYNDFIKYLSDRTGKKIAIKQRRKYSEINSLLKEGKAQFALTCTGAFLSGQKEFGLELLVIPVVNGITSYNSYLIVNRESKAESFKELQGKVFAFTDPLSFSGRMYPMYVMHKMGVKPETFFKRTFYTTGHEKSIKSVALGLAEAAAVDSLIYDDMKRMNDPSIEKVKIIEVSPPYGIPPIVISPAVEKSTKELILRTLLQMKDNPEGREVLRKIQVDKYILPDPVIYDNAAKVRNITLSQ
jgi:phosphonate transport system substrate-binding protein